MEGGGGLSLIIMLLAIGGFCLLFFYAIKNAAKNLPTWEGIIISALLGMLPLYLILCFFGWMGEESDRYR
ncbi:MAG: hypothetical protein IJG54_01835 [Bacteroidales bacterium]|nr:hypothetical protein [Bacteroidales bacterium]